MTKEEQEMLIMCNQLVLDYIHMRNLPEGDYYDLLILNLIREIDRYLSDTKLQQKFKFKDIAKLAMKRAVYNEQQKKRRVDIISFDSLCNASIVVDICGCKKPESSNQLESKTMWIKIGSEMNHQEREIFKLKAEGFTFREIAQELGLSVNGVKYRFYRTRERLFKSGLRAALNEF